MRKEKIKKNYLKYLGIKKKYLYKYINCEICSSKNLKVLRTKISWNNNKFGILPVCCCLNCGFIFQNPRFEEKFYKNFYSDYYRKKIYTSKIPSKSFLIDQKKRGQNIFDYLNINYDIPKKGNFLDVGCSVGLMLLPFLEIGWKCFGNDPDIHYVNYGKEKYKLPIEYLSAEKMKFPKNYFDVILIAGSLEHCFNPNIIMDKCSKFAKKNSLLILEARGEPRSTSKHYFNHNHHRYFSLNSLELMMIKHGWKPLETTMFPISGPTREGGIWCIGEFHGKKVSKNFKFLIKNGKRESFKSIKSKFNYYDLINKNINPNRGDYRENEN